MEGTDEGQCEGGTFIVYAPYNRPSVSDEANCRKARRRRNIVAAFFLNK